MNNNELDWARLGRYVRTARGARAQKDITASGGPSDETLSKIEQGRWTPTRSVQSTLEKLEKGLGWAPGSANVILAGGDPTQADANTPATPAGTGRVVVNLDQNSGDLVTTLTEVLQTSELPASAQARLEGLRDDVLIRQFPSLYDELSLVGKLKVAHFGHEVRREEQENDHANPSSDATQPNASAEASQDQEAALLSDLKSGFREMADRVEANPELFGLAARTERDPKEDGHE